MKRRWWITALVVVLIAFLVGVAFLLYRFAIGAKDFVDFTKSSPGLGRVDCESEVIANTSMHFMGKGSLASHDSELFLPIVTDGLYLGSTDSSDPVTLDSWSFLPVDLRHDELAFLSVACFEDHPTILYYDRQEKALRFAQTTSSIHDGAADWVTYSLEVEDGPTAVFELVNVAGKPTFVFGGRDSHSLYYAQAMVPCPRSKKDWEITLIAEELESNASRSLAVVAGKPMVCFGVKDGPLQIARALSIEPTGVRDWVVTDLPAEVQAGRYPQLVEVDGRAGLIYYLHGPERIGYTWAKTCEPSGAEDWYAQVLIDWGIASFDYSLVEYHSKPLIAFSSQEAIFLVEAGSAKPETRKDWLMGMYDMKDETPVLSSFSLTIHQGRPVAVCQDYMDDRLWLIKVVRTPYKPTTTDVLDDLKT